MRVLLISNSYPRDLRTYVTGTFQRMRMFIEAIKEIAQLDLLFYVAPDVDTSPTAVAMAQRELSRYWQTDIRLDLCHRNAGLEKPSRWSDYFEGVGSFFRQAGYCQTSERKQVDAFERCLRRRPDLVFVHRLTAICPLLLTREPLPPILFDLDDIEHVYFLRGVDQQWRWHSKLIYYARLPALLAGEVRAIRLASKTFVCSDKDRKYLGQRWKLPGIVTIPNSVASSELLPVTAEPTLLLLGAYWYQPNVEAAEFLLGKIWPHIRAAVPTARLIVAGSRPEEISADLRRTPGVEFPGFVDDLESLYMRSRVVCCPILRGGGTRIKIIEAAAHGKPVISTPIGAEGLDFRDGHEILIRDDAISFANACVELLADDSLCARLGQASYDAVNRYYARDRIKGLIQSEFMTAYDQQVNPLTQGVAASR